MSPLIHLILALPIILFLEVPQSPKFTQNFHVFSKAIIYAAVTIHTLIEQIVLLLLAFASSIPHAICYYSVAP